MKRRVVQHGPSTLTISLPARWVQERGVKKGDELTVAPMQNGLLITTSTSRKPEVKRISVKGLLRLVTKAVAALYKYGYDEIVVEYGSPEELERIHTILSTGYIGFEIIEETKSEVRIRQVSEPQNEEFRTLFRRVFHFLLTTADETLEAMKQHNTATYGKLILRDDNINKLTDFCRRVVNKGGQSTYRSDTAIYHVVEQLEKIGDAYKHLNQRLATRRKPCSPAMTNALAGLNRLLRDFETLFFEFSLEKAEAFLKLHDAILGEMDNASGSMPKDELPLLFIIQNAVEETADLIGAVMILQL